MKIKEYEDLTSYMSDEWMKVSETFGAQKPSKKIMDFVTKNLIKHIDMYDKPLHKLKKIEIKNMFFVQKRELELQRAIDTMPHGKIWKFFHSDLWERIKYREEHSLEGVMPKEDAQGPPSVVETTVPVILPKQDVPMVVVDDVENDF